MKVEKRIEKVPVTTYEDKVVGYTLQVSEEEAKVIKFLCGWVTGGSKAANAARQIFWDLDKMGLRAPTDIIKSGAINLDDVKL